MAGKPYATRESAQNAPISYILHCITMHYGWGYGIGGEHGRARGAGFPHMTPPPVPMSPHPHPTQYQCRASRISPSISPSRRIQSRSQPPYMSPPPAIPSPHLSPPYRFSVGLGGIPLGRPFSHPPIPRSLAIYGQKKNQKNCLQSIDSGI